MEDSEPAWSERRLHVSRGRQRRRARHHRILVPTVLTLLGVTVAFVGEHALTGAHALATPTRMKSRPQTTSTGPAASPTPISASAQPADEVATLAAQRPAGSVSVVVVDTATNARYEFGQTTGMTCGSVIKLFLLEADLLRQQDDGDAPGGDDDTDLTAMIEYSDNDAADRIYAVIGGYGGADEAVSRLGLTDTDLPESGEWGLSTSSAADQVTLLGHLVSTDGPLSDASRSYALNLMDNVEDDQRWGVGVVSDGAGGFANKNGWLGVDDDDDRWLVNSDGIVTSHGHQLLISVMTQHDEDFPSGVDLVEALARAAVAKVEP